MTVVDNFNGIFQKEQLFPPKKTNIMQWQLGKHKTYSIKVKIFHSTTFLTTTTSVAFALFPYL